MDGTRGFPILRNPQMARKDINHLNINIILVDQKTDQN